jgi:hypothetical protein
LYKAKNEAKTNPIFIRRSLGEGGQSQIYLGGFYFGMLHFY